MPDVLTNDLDFSEFETVQLTDREKAVFMCGLRSGLEFAGGKVQRKKLRSELQRHFTTAGQILTGGAFNPLDVFEFLDWFKQSVK